MTTKDLGTYFVEVHLKDGRGFIEEIGTGGRFTDGRGTTSPLKAKYIKPHYVDEEHLIISTVFMWTEGSFSCDCNLVDFLADANQEHRKDYVACGDTNPVVKLVLIKPD